MWEQAELLSEAYLQAHRLLDTLYDPSKSTVVTFLKAFLWGAVHYAYWTKNGFRFHDEGKKSGGRSRKVVVPRIQYTFEVACEDLSARDVPDTQHPWPGLDLTEEEWTIVRLRLDGYTMTQIAKVIGLKSPQSVYNRLVKIRGKIEGVDNAARDSTDAASKGWGEERT